MEEETKVSVTSKLVNAPVAFVVAYNEREGKNYYELRIDNEPRPIVLLEVPEEWLREL